MAKSTAMQLAGQRARLLAKSQKVERTMLMSAAGLALGAAEAAGKLPVSLMGLPTKLVLGIAGHLVAANTSGSSARIASTAGDTCLAVYSYSAGKNKSIIAGVEEEYE